jgi:hypothetical protein
MIIEKVNVGDSKIERTKSLLCEIFKHKTFFCSQRENGYSVNYCVQNRWRSIGKNFITTVDEKSFFDGEIPE